MGRRWPLDSGLSLGFFPQGIFFWPLLHLPCIRGPVVSFFCMIQHSDFQHLIMWFVMMWSAGQRKLDWLKKKNITDFKRQTLWNKVETHHISVLCSAPPVWIIISLVLQGEPQSPMSIKQKSIRIDIVCKMYYLLRLSYFFHINVSAVERHSGTINSIVTVCHGNCTWLWWAVFASVKLCANVRHYGPEDSFQYIKWVWHSPTWTYTAFFKNLFYLKRTDNIDHFLKK